MKSVPTEVFESSTQQTISLEIDFDVTGPVSVSMHASETYSLTLQRVNEDGSPL